MPTMTFLHFKSNWSDIPTRDFWGRNPLAPPYSSTFIPLHKKGCVPWEVGEWGESPEHAQLQLFLCLTSACPQWGALPSALRPEWGYLLWQGGGHGWDGPQAVLGGYKPKAQLLTGFVSNGASFAFCLLFLSDSSWEGNRGLWLRGSRHPGTCDEHCLSRLFGALHAQVLGHREHRVVDSSTESPVPGEKTGTPEALPTWPASLLVLHGEIYHYLIFRNHPLPNRTQGLATAIHNLCYQNIWSQALRFH